MNPVNAALFNAMGALFLPEAGRIGGEGLRQAFYRQNLVNKPADHGVLGGADEIQVLALNLVHHTVHVCLGHDTLHNVAVNHKGRDAVGETLVDHEVPAIGQNRFVQAGNVTQQIIKAISGNPSRGIQVDAVEALHDIHMIGDLKVRHNRLTEALHFHVAGVVRTQGHGIINHLGNHQHPLVNLVLQLVLQLFQLCQPGGLVGDLFLHRLRLRQLGRILLGLSHQHADLLAELVPVRPELVCLRNGGAALGVQINDLIYQRQLGVLKLLFDVLFYSLGIFPDKLDIQHLVNSPCSFDFISGSTAR